MLLYCFLGETALIHAARQGHTDTAKYLIDHGANPAIASNLGATALHHSAGIGAYLFVTSLIYAHSLTKYTSSPSAFIIPFVIFKKVKSIGLLSFFSSFSNLDAIGALL